jgi:hypothetical protein
MTGQRKPQRGSPAGIGYRLQNRRVLLVVFFAAVVVIAALMYMFMTGLGSTDI